VFIVPKHIWGPKEDANDSTKIELVEPLSMVDTQGKTTAEAKALMVGSGPFIFREYLKTSAYIVDKNPNYWQTPAKIDTLILQYYANANAAILALKSGEVDAYTNIENPTQVAPLMASENIKVDVVAGYNHSEMLLLNLRFEPFNLLKVRQAISTAINRQDIIDFAQSGYGTWPQNVPYAGGLAETNPNVIFKDVAGGTQTARAAAANVLLDAASTTRIVISTIANGVGGYRTVKIGTADPVVMEYEAIFISSPGRQR